MEFQKPGPTMTVRVGFFSRMMASASAKYSFQSAGVSLRDGSSNGVLANHTVCLYLIDGGYGFFDVHSTNENFTLIPQPARGIRHTSRLQTAFNTLALARFGVAATP
jgi:hypothetical protein